MRLHRDQATKRMPPVHCKEGAMKQERSSPRHVYSEILRPVLPECGAKQGTGARVREWSFP